MSRKFSFFLSFTDSFKENDVGVFQADDGDIYIIKYRSNVCRDLLLKVEWRIPKQILVAVKLYNKTFKRCFSSRGLALNGRKAFIKVRSAFNVSRSQNYKVLCVITFIPYIKFNACNDIASTSFDSGFQERDSQKSLIEGRNDIYDKTSCRRENVEEYNDVINITHTENNVTVSSEFESPESAMKTEQELQSGEKDSELNKTPTKDGKSIVKSKMNTINKYEEKKLLTVRSEFLPIDIQKTRDEMKETEINSDMVDCSESISPVPSSSKTDFVIQELAAKLSVDDSDLETKIKDKDHDLDIFLKSPLRYRMGKIKKNPVMENQLKGLSLDMLELLTTGDFTDAEIYNGEKCIKVHRAILSARSLVFKQMLIQQKQKSSKYCVFVDIPSNILEKVIIFMYVGHVYINNVKSAQDLQEVAKRYRINDLIEICSKYISK